MNGWVVGIERVAHALGNAVVQSLWQCVLIGAFCALCALSVRRASLRHGVWCFGLIACAVWFVLTLVSGLRAEQVPLAMGYAHALGDSVQSRAGIQIGLFEVVALCWACGFGVVFARFGVQWRNAWRLRTRGILAMEPAWELMYKEVRAALRVSERVCLRVSERARCPMVVGVVSPVVVVPVSVMTMMSPAQVRMILAHELAHVRRYDHVLNMAQVFVETVMFYHPVVWWMSRQARIEREHCCDDVAVRVTGDALGYARALTELEEVRIQSRAVLGLQGGSLMKRVQRIVGDDAGRRGSVSVKVMAAVLTATMIGVAACTTGFVREEAAVYDTYDALRAAVASGEVSADEAREIYERELLPSSIIMSRSIDERAYWVETLATYALSEERLASTLDEMERSFDQRIERDFRTRVLGEDGLEVVLSMYREDLERYKREEGLSDAVAERMYARKVEELSKPPLVVNPSGVATQQETSVIHQYAVKSPKGDTVNGAPVRLVEGNQVAGVYEVKDDVPEGSDLEPGQRIRFTPGMSMGMARAMRGQAAEEQWLLQYGGGVEVEPEVEAEPELESEPQGRRLTPMDEEYWHHQGIRSLDVYDDTFVDDC